MCVTTTSSRWPVMLMVATIAGASSPCGDGSVMCFDVTMGYFDRIRLL